MSILDDNIIDNANQKISDMNDLSDLFLLIIKNALSDHPVRFKEKIASSHRNSYRDLYKLHIKLDKPKNKPLQIPKNIIKNVYNTLKSNKIIEKFEYDIREGTWERGLGYGESTCSVIDNDRNCIISLRFAEVVPNIYRLEEEGYVNYNFDVYIMIDPIFDRNHEIKKLIKSYI